MNAQCPHKCWSTLKSAVFGSNSDSFLPPLIGAGGGLVCESVGKAEILSAHFDGKQCSDPVDLLSTCHPSPSLTSSSRWCKWLALTCGACSDARLHGFGSRSQHKSLKATVSITERYSHSPVVCVVVE